ncbi:MAG: type I glutamate--ammonia ligase [Alphaproteobacteria bacterium]|nr:type I glutamate--ammonia ligase [Alphaproteobacteria bacterium]
MADAAQILQTIKDEDVQFVELRFTDPRGKWHHLTLTADQFDEDSFEEGFMFDGSSIDGWKAINESDMTLMPDASRFVIDPFTADVTMVLFCDIQDPISGQAYNRDPRSIAKRAVQYVSSLGIGDQVFLGPEAEFFMFDDVRFSTEPHCMSYSFDDVESPFNTNKKYEEGNYGHRPRVKGGYFPVAPVDSASDIRNEMVTTLVAMGLKMDKQHHEVAPSQHELGIVFDELVVQADNMQLYKYATRMVAHTYGKTATFMPKPVVGDNGSGMHINISIFKDGQNTFAGSQYADLSENCLYFIGGVIKHACALNAFTNPSTNSYKRLIPGYEAPVLLAYSSRNRSASCRIPFAFSPKAKRLEVRFPDPTANPYLAFTAILMAGIDGIENKIHPGDPMDKNLYDLPPEELANVPHVAGSLREALDALSADRNFLKHGEVMTDDMIDGYVSLKLEEVKTLEHTTHPVEYSMYYSA